MPVTLFSWGYHGWGNATDHLVCAADAVEADRGFRPPLFVDTRIRRAVRARGFQGAAFESLLGPGRHAWLRGLGNEAIRTGEGGIRISDPSAAGELLDLACADPGRRVVFFCSCQWQKHNGGVVCHRHEVGSLVLAEAHRRETEVEVIEWPGGEPGRVALPAEPAVVTAVRRGRGSVPLGEDLPGPELRGLPWGSAVLLHADDRAALAVAGPARHRAGLWELPVLEAREPDAGPEAALRGSAQREALGLNRRA